MADRSRDARYVPALVGLLLLIFGGAAWLLYTLTTTVADRPGGVESLIYIQAASIQARQALNGDDEVWSTLQATGTELGRIRTTNLTDAEKRDLGLARTHVTAVLDARGDSDALRRIIGRLSELVPGMTDGIRKLQADRTVQNRPVAWAQLERLNLLAESVRLLAQKLPQANERTNTAVRDREKELQQLVKALQAGDEELGIEPLGKGATEVPMSVLARRAAQIGSSALKGVMLAEQLTPALGAAYGLEALVQGSEPTRAAVSSKTDMAGLELELARVYGLLGAGAFLLFILLIIWMRSSGSRRETDKLVQQSEMDQKAILQLLDELDSLADGDLTVEASVNESITGAIADSVNYAVEALRDLVETINEGAILLDDTTRQTKSSAHALELASEAQARQMKNASAAVRQIVGSIDEVSGDAERSADVARHSVDIAHKGGDAVRRTIEGMNTIRETIQDTSKRIKRLGESSQEIGNIVELINDIADQTNLLALNASIQASTAGESGRGFAVVADEVQRLAERSTNATKQIEVLVSTIQSDTNEAVVSMERSTTDVVGGALLAENAGAALEEIEQVSNQIAMLVQNISGSAKDQAEAAKAVLQNVDQLQEISSETGKSAAMTAKYVSKLSTLASQLREAAAGFRLPGQNPSSRDHATEQAEAEADEPAAHVLPDGGEDGEDNERAVPLITDDSAA